MSEAPLLLLPGTLCDGRVFALATSGIARRTLVVPMAGARSAAEMARLVLETAPGRFALCGFSLGAIVALEVIAQAPGRVERLALIGCNPGPVDPASIPGRRAALDLARRQGCASYVDAVWERSVPRGRRADDGLRAGLKAMAAATPLESFRDQVEIAIDRVDSRPRLGRIAVPTLALCGAEDQICPPAMSEQIAARVAGARLAIVPGAGHYVTIDRPDAVAGELAEWLRRPPLCLSHQFLKELS